MKIWKLVIDSWFDLNWCARLVGCFRRRRCARLGHLVLDLGLRCSILRSRLSRSSRVLLRRSSVSVWLESTRSPRRLRHVLLGDR